MYVSSMRYVNDFASRKGYTVQSIFEVESEQLQDIAKEVLEDEEFIAYNIEKHNRFSAALQAYLLFRLGGGVVTDTKTKTRKRNLSAFEKDSRLMDFINWLVSEKGLAENTSRSYASNVKSAEVYALEKDIIHSGLFDASDDEIKDLVSLILNDAEFSEYNTQQHNRFSAALQAYLLYRIGERAGVSDIKPRKRSGRIEDTISCSDDLRGLIEERFAFGIRPESAIDILKLRNYASMADISLVEDDELLAKQIAAGGILCDGKVYFFPNEVSQELKDKIQTIFDEDYSVLYYEEFFDRNYDWLDERHITSWEILRELIQSEIDDVFASKNFFSSGNNRINELDAVEQEIAAFWGDTPIHTYDEVYELLPYIPNDKLKFYLSCSEKFVWSSAETFAYVDRLIITEEEKEAIIEFVTEKCANAGYATISDIPLGNIEEENYQMSLNAIYDAIYFSVLKSRFSINGKILTNNSESIDILSLAKAYCVDKDTLSFAAFHKYVTKLNGTSNRQVAYKAAYDTMIRVTEDQFVADRFVDFNVDEIDELLDQYIVGGFASIKSIASFALFPSCHYPWNHYVLESFCYKYSKKYSLQVINFNEKNAGIIAKQDLPLSYMDMAATAAARSGLELTEDIIGRYLCDNGFFAKSKMSALKDIINKAKELREAL